MLVGLFQPPIYSPHDDGVTAMLDPNDRTEINRVSAQWKRRRLSAEEACEQLQRTQLRSSIADVWANLPSEMLAAIDECWKRPPMRAIGYWKSDEEPHLPDPILLSKSNLTKAKTASVIQYLRSGQKLFQWRGVSYCRFHCGRSDWEMGSRCLTDGEWVWPEGLSHYVEAHAVALPAEFIDRVKAFSRRSEQNCDIRRLVDLSYWLNWARNQQQ